MPNGRTHRAKLQAPGPADEIRSSRNEADSHLTGRPDKDGGEASGKPDNCRTREESACHGKSALTRLIALRVGSRRELVERAPSLVAEQSPGVSRWRYAWLIALVVVALLHIAMGVAGLGSILGLLYTAPGIGALIGAPTAGWLIDTTDSYRSAIVWCIATSTLAVGLLTGLPVDESGRLERAPNARG